MGCRSLSFAALAIWISLPQHFRSSNSLWAFQGLKTFLCKKFLPPNFRPLWKKIAFSHWESQWDCSKIKISMRSWARTSLRIKNLIKNLIKSQEPHQEPHQKSRSWARPYWDSHWDSQWGLFLIDNLNENLNEVSPKILIFGSTLDDINSFQLTAWWPRQKELQRNLQYNYVTLIYIALNAKISVQNAKHRWGPSLGR